MRRACSALLMTVLAASTAWVAPTALASGPTTSNLASFYNSVLVSPDTNRGCTGVNSTYLSAEALAAANPQIVPGGTITTGGFSFSWPSSVNCVNDSVSAAGQMISVGEQHGATALGLLGTGVGGAAVDTLTVHYSDGSSINPTVAFGDWCNAAIAGNNTRVASMTYRNDNGIQQNVNCYLFLDTINGLDPNRIVTSITLPTSSMLRIVAVALNGDAITGAGAAPDAPTGLGATPGTRRVDLTWNPSAGAAGYNVYRDSIVSGSAVTAVTAGDISDCTNNDDELTAELVDAYPGATVLTLGDSVYENGSPTEFANCYDPTWGRAKARTEPAVGNHEYQTTNATGYYNYFGAAAGDPTKGYYSYTLGTWHVVVLNANCSIVSCATGSAQELWLRSDLAASTSQCTLAYWHQPRFSSGATHGDNLETQPLWKALYDYNAELVLNGHEHIYERFAPLSDTGAADPSRGITEMIVGTGGHSHYTWNTPEANSLVRNGDTFGILHLDLAAGGWNFQFIPEAGHSFTDSGSGTCHDANGPIAGVRVNGNAPVVGTSFADTTAVGGVAYHYTVKAVDATGHESSASTPATATVDPAAGAPAAPTGLTATAGVSSVALQWNANTEPDLAGYRVYRSTTTPVSTSGNGLNGAPLLTATNYTDNAAVNNTTYHYVVTAVDIGALGSASSNEVTATPGVPATPTILTISPTSAKAGDLVTIAGGGFGASQVSGNCIHVSDANELNNGTSNWGLFGNLGNAGFPSPTSWSDTSITFRVPIPADFNDRRRVRPGSTATVAFHSGGGCASNAGTGGADVSTISLPIANSTNLADYFGDDSKMLTPAVGISLDSTPNCGAGASDYHSAKALANGLTVTTASWSAGTATITLSGTATALANGSTVTVAGVKPDGYNGTFTVTGSSTTTVQYALASNPGTFASAGTITYTIPITGASWASNVATLTFAATSFYPDTASSNGNNTPSLGYLQVSGMNPSGYNGGYRVTAATSTSISYALTTNPGTYVSGGTALDGVWPGRSITFGGYDFSWPAPAACYSDTFNSDLWNAASGGDATILFPTRTGADSIGILGAGFGGATSVNVTITYTDNSTLTGKTADFNDWCNGSPTQTILTQAKYRNTGNATRAAPACNVYLKTITGLDTAKVVKSISFDHTGTNAGGQRIWAIALNGVPATTTTVTSSQNPSVHAQGVTFTATVTSATSGTPTGTVNFKDGATTITGCGAVSLNGSAQATCGPITDLTTTAHTITAVYSGDSSFATSTSASFIQTVNKAESGVSVQSDNNPSDSGEAVTFTATVASGAGTPSGTVQFQIDGSDFGTPMTLVAGQVQSDPISNLSLGSHLISAVYSGDADFLGDTADPLTQNVNGVGLASTTTSLESDDQTSVHGQGVTFTATVTSGSVGTITGTVEFKDGATDLCAAATISAGQASCGPISTLTNGDHSITAIYSGDGSFATSTSPDFTQSVGKADTTTTITGVSLGTATVAGETYTVSWTVVANSPGSGTPTGTVTITGDVGCSASVAAGQCSFAATSPGTKSLVATYGGDTDFNGSASSPATTHQVNKADTTTTITGVSLGTATVVGQSYTVSWSVVAAAPGTGTPSGSVTVSGGSGCTAAVSDGQCDVTSTDPGTKSLIATYGGDTNFNGSASSPATTHVVNKADSTTTITGVSLGTATVVGQSYTVSWTVVAKAPGAGTPTGTVTITGDVGCSASVAAGQCSFAATSPGTKHLVATYGGDTNFSGGASSPATNHAVNLADTTTTITGTSLATNTVVGQSYTVSWSVAPVIPGAGTPTGTVTISGGSGCTAAVSTGHCDVTSTEHGNKTIVATYNGDSNFNVSASVGTAHTVNAAGTTTAVVSNLNPATVGQQVTFTATVSVTAPGAGTPTGTVAFKDGVNTIGGCGSQPLNGGLQAQCQTSSLPAGTHSITATYTTDANFATSTSTALSQVVNTVAKANTTTALARTAGTAPSVWGQSVTFTATVSATSGTPTGTVQFKVDGVNSGSPVTLSSGHASISLTALAVRASPGHTITAVYSGDSAYNGSTSGTLSQIVNKAKTTTTLVSDKNPAPRNTAVHLTATIAVTLPGAGTPTGRVVFKVNGVIVARVVVQAGGTATFTISKPKGTYKVIAIYKGDAHFATSKSVVLSQVFT